MDKKEARRLFKEARRLFKSGHYQESLDYLADLNGNFPDNFNILYPILMCRERLGCTDEAQTLCKQMLQQFFGTKERAKLFRTYSRLSRQAAGGEYRDDQRTELPDSGDNVLLDSSGIIQIAGYWIAWRRVLLAFIIIGCVIAGLAVIPVVLNNMTPLRSLNNETLFLALLAFHLYLWNCFACYAALWASNNLVHGDLLRDILDAFLFVPAVLFLFSSIFWFRFTNLFITDQYNMGFKESTVFLLTLILFNVAYFYFILGGHLGEKVARMCF